MNPREGLVARSVYERRLDGLVSDDVALWGFSLLGEWRISKQVNMATASIPSPLWKIIRFQHFPSSRRETIREETPLLLCSGNP
jgi:hypothetical protein